MPERLGFDRDLSGADFLAFHWRLSGGDPSNTGIEVGAAADRVGLERGVLYKKLRTYSRGMLQRIGVAQATLGSPELLFLDEPASGTDPLGVAVVRERILEAKARGATIVLNSHQLPEVERVCDRVVFIDHGRLTRSETLTGEAASRRRTVVRVPPDRAPRRRRSSRPRVSAPRPAPRACCASPRAPRRTSPGPSRRSPWPTCPSSRCAPRPSSRSSSARLPRHDRDGPPLPAAEVQQPRRRDRALGAGAPGRLAAAPRAAAREASRWARWPDRPRRGVRLEGRLERSAPDDPLPADPRSEYLLGRFCGILAAYGIFLLGSIALALLFSRVLGPVLGAQAPPLAFAALGRQVAAALLGAVGMAAPILLLSTFLPGYGDVLGYILLTPLLAIPDLLAQILKNPGLQKAGEALRKNLLPSVDWSAVLSGHNPLGEATGRWVLAVVVYLVLALWSFSRREFAYGQD